MNHEIQITDVGPIESLSIPITPGVNVLKGPQGSGKSTAIRGVQRMLGGSANDLSARDGAKRGEITLGDASLTITRSRAAVRGELEVVGIESRLDIASLVDPGIADPEKADNKRIKALVNLSGVKANPAIFFEICGGDREYAALGIDEQTPDILLLATRVKRALEAKARVHEESSEQYTAQCRALQKAIESVDLDAQCDEGVLLDNYSRACAEIARIRQHNEDAQRASAAAKEASATLAEMSEGAENPEALDSEAKHYREQAANRLADIESLKLKIATLEAEARALNDKAENCISRRIVAERQAQKRAKLAEQAAAAVPASICDKEIAASIQAAIDAKEAMDRGAAIRLARKQAEEAQAKDGLAKANTAAGRKFRRAALAVDGVVSSLLPSDCPLRVEGGRLVTATDRGQSELYADLSDGERWILAVRFAAKQLPPGGLLTLSQTAWGEIQPANRKLIADEAKRLGVAILTAEAADCELTAEAMNGSPIGSETPLPGQGQLV